MHFSSKIASMVCGASLHAGAAHIHLEKLYYKKGLIVYVYLYLREL